MKEKKLTCEKAKQICLIKTLQNLGSSPTKETNNDAWFLSPFRTETKASFKVSKSLNRWYDHGLGKGGNVIDLIMQHKNYSVKETLEFLSGNISPFSFHQQPKNLTRNNEFKSYRIIKVKNLDNQALLNYLESRCIKIEVAKKYCQEIYYEMNGKNYFAICFKNDFDGYEIRNKYFKSSFLKKGITTIKNGFKKVCVFEGFINFLSYLSLFSNDENEDFIILNSVAFLEKAISKIKKYSSVYSYLDNDNSGKNALNLLKQSHYNVINCSEYFIEHNDLNDYLMFKCEYENKHEA